jgi:hypothetical protein
MGGSFHIDGMMMIDDSNATMIFFSSAIATRNVGNGSV